MTFLLKEIPSISQFKIEPRQLVIPVRPVRANKDIPPNAPMIGAESSDTFTKCHRFVCALMATRV